MRVRCLPYFSEFQFRAPKNFSEPYPVKSVEEQISLELLLISDVQHGRVRGDGEGGDGGAVSRAA